MVLKQIITRNIQNHREVIIDFNPTGLTVFTGDNSNGKSVIVKVTKALITGSIRKPRKRNNLVNREAQFGEAIYTRDDDVVLKLHLAREAALTYITYTEPGREPITRYLADKSYSDLVRKFGWHYDENTGVSLNIAEADDSLLFYKTSNRDIASVIETATSDSTANAVIEQFTNTIGQLRSLREQYNMQLRQYESTIAELQVEETEFLKEQREVYFKVYSLLSNMYIPTLPEIRPVPNVKLLNLPFPEIPEIRPVPNVKVMSLEFPKIPIIRFPALFEVKVNIPSLDKWWEDMQALQDMRCPTCGRRLAEHDSEDTIHIGPAQAV